jgi:hypothetical protein
MRPPEMRRRQLRPLTTNPNATALTGLASNSCPATAQMNQPR